MREEATLSRGLVGKSLEGKERTSMKNGIGLKKRIVKGIASQIVLLFVFAGQSSNLTCAYAGSDGVWSWTTKYRGALTGYCGSSKTPVVPSIVTDDEGYSWNVSWLFETFSGNSNITAVTLTAGIRTLTWAFQDCVNLSHVTIQGDTINLGIYSFKGCASLHDIDFLPDSVTSIGQSAFAGCTGLKTLNLPTALTNLDIGAFGGCTSLTSIRTSPPLQRMGGYAPSGDLGGGQFARCTNLKQAWIDGDGLLLPHGMLGYCSNLEEVVIGDGAIGVYVKSNSWKVQYAQPFVGDTKLRNLTVGTGITNIPPGFCSNLTGLCSAAFHGFRDTIGQSAFQGCSSLTNLELGSTWTPGRVETLAFAGCKKFSGNVDFSKCTSIGGEAFSDCLTWSFGNVDIPLVTNLGWEAFANCNGLTSLTLGKGMTNIGRSALAGCMGLEKISVDKDNPVYASDKGVLFSKDMGSILLFPKGKKGAYVIPNSVTNLYNNSSQIGGSSYSFNGCINLTSVTIPDSIKYVNSKAFQGCSNLTSVTIAGGVEYIGAKAFDGCINLTNIWFKGGVPETSPDYSSFTNVASGAKGFYPAAYSSEWKAAITNGMWCGLIMEEAKAPSCELRVAQADPAAGSLTLAWQETTPVEGVTYSVYRSANDTYSETDLVADGLTGTSWTDTDYWSAKPVLKPLNYWVVADGGGYGKRASKPVETRHRYGVFVGVNEFKTMENLAGLEEQAELFGKLARENGEFPSDNVKVLTGENATRAKVRRALWDVAEKTQTGDYVVVFCNSHGGGLDSEIPEFLGIYLYDTKNKETLYTKKALAADLKTLATANGKNGLSVVVFLNTCYSGGAVSVSPDGQNFAWIVACRESEEGTHFKCLGTVLPHFLLKYGWQCGGAAKGSGTMATFADLADYAMSSMEKLRQMEIIDEHPRTDGSQDVLRHFIAGRSDTAPHEHIPGTPTVTVTAVNEGLLTISWEADPQAEYFAWARKNENDGRQLAGMVTGDVHIWHDDGEKLGISYLPVQSCLYRIAAINEHGISEWSKPERGTFVNKFWKWLVDKYVGFIIDELTSEETVAAVAASASANGASYEACYVADIDPNDPDAAFRAKLVRDDGRWRAYPMDGEKEGRVYRVEGKKEMADESWTDVTDVEDLEAEGWHFFRVGVELAE